MKISPQQWWRCLSCHTSAQFTGMLCASACLALVATGAVVLRAVPGNPALMALTGMGASHVADGEEGIEVADSGWRIADGENLPSVTPSPTRPLAHSSSDFEIVEEIAIDPSDSMIRWFDGRPVRPAKRMVMRVTAYSPDARSCAPYDDGITASGFSVYTNGGNLIAADRMFRFGSLISVPGYNGNRPTPVLDRGGAIRGNRLDVLYPTHEEALEWGVQMLEVTIWEYLDGEKPLRR